MDSFFNRGVTEDVATKQFMIEEKGEVYNDMKTSMNSPFYLAYQNTGKLLCGSEHPLSYNAGGNLDNIRILMRQISGYGAKMKDVKGGNYFAIGPQKQMAAYETYLQSKEGVATKLYSIYPRDFWMVPE